MPPARAFLYAATLAGIVLAVWSFLTKPPPLGVALVVLGGYFALLVAGAMLIRLRMFVDAVTRGPRDARGVALTFDDGPHPTWTPKVLDALDAAGARATFFVIGRKAEKHPDLVRAIAARGHAVGVHSYAHDRLFAMRGEKRVRADIERAIAVVEAILGERPTLFRPPIGHTNPTIARVCDALDLTVIGWSVAGRDGLARAVPARVAARVRSGVRDGAIVLLHDAAERDDHEPAGPKALPEVLDAIAAANLRVVPLADLLPSSGD